MGTFGGTLWGGGSSSSQPSVGVLLSSVLDAALRIAGLLSRPGWKHSDDQYTELIAAANRMLGSWNCDGHKIYTSSIEPFDLVAGQKIYTIGPGGDFDTTRPVYIVNANVLFPTSPVVRQPVYIMDDDEWSEIAVQDIEGAPPYQLYYDGGLDSNGRGNIYLRFQPPAGYILELYTWQQLTTTFTSKEDIANFPPGYEEAIVWNLAVYAAGLNPRESMLSPMAPEQARRSLVTLISLNSRAPRIGTEPGLDADGLTGGVKGWLSGDIR